MKLKDNKGHGHWRYLSSLWLKLLKFPANMAHENLAEEVLQFQSQNIQLLENNQVTPSKAALAQFPYIYPL